MSGGGLGVDPPNQDQAAGVDPVETTGAVEAAAKAICNANNEIYQATNHRRYLHMAQAAIDALRLTEEIERYKVTRGAHRKLTRSRLVSPWVVFSGGTATKEPTNE